MTFEIVEQISLLDPDSDEQLKTLHDIYLGLECEHSIFTLQFFTLQHYIFIKGASGMHNRNATKLFRILQNGSSRDN